MNKEKPQRIISAEAKEALYGSVCCDSIATKTKETMTKAEEYSFLIESILFQQLSKEQQKLWRKEIEQAYNAGAEWTYKDVLQTIDKLLLYLDCDAYTTDARIGMRVFTNELKKRLTV